MSVCVRACVSECERVSVCDYVFCGERGCSPLPIRADVGSDADGDIQNMSNCKHTIQFEYVPVSACTRLRGNIV